MDLADKESTDHGLREALSMAGSALEVVVNAAGDITPVRLLPKSADAPDPLEAVHRELYVEVQAMATIVQRCGAAMAKQRRGTIVFASSAAAYWSNWLGLGAHAGGAGAKLSFLEAAFEELRVLNIRICLLVSACVACGVVDRVCVTRSYRAV
jgi:short-subunit dehydrogenase